MILLLKYDNSAEKTSKNSGRIQRRYNKDPTTELGTLTTYTRCLAQLRLPSVLFLIRLKDCIKVVYGDSSVM